MSNKVNRDKALMQRIESILSERDESIRQTFSAFDQKIGASFQQLGFQQNIMFELMKRLGITDEQIKAVAEELNQQAASQIPQQKEESNEHPYDGASSEEGGNNPENNEKGQEHFS